LVACPDAVLSSSTEIIATADSVILDRCQAWFNLAKAVVSRCNPPAWILDLANS
jgi:hypothetical protein